ncbi:MAG: hypothetical protein WC285_04205, partial [Candidatus Gracilibacteria bacterium]
NTIGNADDYENLGKYAETKSCKTDKFGKSYMTSAYETCPFGCFDGTCMPKCEAPGKDNIFFKSFTTGFSPDVIGFIKPGTAYPPPSQPDYCTNKEGTEVLGISKYLAKGYCDSNNLVGKNIVECSSLCFDGACQKNPTLYCEDTDLNDKGKIPGKVTYYNPNSKVPVTNTDSCIDDKTVTEYFCGKDRLPHKLILTCRNTCSEGQCI